MIGDSMAKNPQRLPAIIDNAGWPWLKPGHPQDEIAMSAAAPIQPAGALPRQRTPMSAALRVGLVGAGWAAQGERAHVIAIADPLAETTGWAAP